MKIKSETTVSVCIGNTTISMTYDEAMALIKEIREKLKPRQESVDVTRMHDSNVYKVYTEVEDQEIRATVGNVELRMPRKFAEELRDKLFVSTHTADKAY